MTIEEILTLFDQNPLLALLGVLLLSLLVLFLGRRFIGRGLYYLAGRTESAYDDILVQSLRPFRFAWIMPLLVIYSFANLLPEIEIYIQKSTLFLMLWVGVITLNSMMEALNKIYESRPSYSGVSIKSYLDLIKILFWVVGVILSISIITGESPIVLLTGLGALTAILLLIFRDTILSLVASVQISTNDLIEEGDWIEVPSYEADGGVIEISLQSIKIQNGDKSISVIPTHKFMEVPFKNWRAMSEGGGRRIKRAIYIDISSIRFCDQETIDRYKKIHILADYIQAKQKEIQEHNLKYKIDDSVLVNGRHLTNVGTFRAYIAAYLRKRTDIHQTGMTFLVRQLAPGPKGLPLEIYVFATTTNLVEYEAIQSDIFDHLLAVLPQFGLRVFQEPTGWDFSVFADGNRNKT